LETPAVPAPIPPSLRQQIWDRHLQQQSAPAIAAALQLPPRTVRHLLRLFRTQGQPTQPRFDLCGRRRCPHFTALRLRVLDLRRQHPRWGAQRILAQLIVDNASGQEELPDPSTIRRWLHQAGLAPAPRPRRAPPAPRASGPHEIWQMDAAEGKTLRSGQRVSWLRLVDEASSAVLFSRVFPLPVWAGVAPQEVQAALRDAFCRWGRPSGLRVDNGKPWVVPDSDLPSDLQMWLAGLAVAVHKNRPSVSQDNPLVERSQRTARDWGEPGTHDTAEQLQARLDEEDRIQREVYLFDGVRSRMEAWPELRWLGNPYSAGAWEAICWDHLLALGSLAGVRLRRLVSKQGRVSLYDHHHRVGPDWAGQGVDVTFCVFSGQWVFWSNDQEVSRQPAWYLGGENICALQVRRRPERAQRCRAAKETPPPTGS
jgi:hypothetical protein